MDGRGLEISPWDRGSGVGVREEAAGVGDTPAVALEGVSRHYGQGRGRVVALEGVSFTVRPGEFLAIMGPSGSGKSTLLNVIGALDAPSGGRVRVGGRDIAALAPVERARYRRREVGFIFQAFNLLPRLTALENVALPLLLDGVAPAERRRRAAALLDEMGLADRLSHTPGTLSGGEQQRVAIARALVNAPRLLLADELTGNLDSRTAQAIVALLTTLHRTRHQTIILITHDAAIAGLAERRVRMHDGRLVAADAPTEV